MRSLDSIRAQKAHERVKSRVDLNNSDKYKTFALGFPALIHSCGLAQALAYAQAKSIQEYQEDLAYVLDEENLETLAELSRAVEFSEYRRLTNEVISSASWIKRYVEAFFKKSEGEENTNAESL